MSELNRREFVVAAACAAGACMMCSGIADAQPAETSANKVNVGSVSDYSKDGVYDAMADSKKVIIVRSGTKITALTAICTHKMGIVKLKNDELVCPKHNSHFANDGTAKSGPAKAALFHLGITQDAAGLITVDKTKTFGEKQWNDPDASITVK